MFKIFLKLWVKQLECPFNKLRFWLRFSWMEYIEHWFYLHRQNRRIFDKVSISKKDLSFVLKPPHFYSTTIGRSSDIASWSIVSESDTTIFWKLERSMQEAEMSEILVEETIWKQLCFQIAIVLQRIVTKISTNKSGHRRLCVNF